MNLSDVPRRAVGVAQLRSHRRFVRDAYRGLVDRDPDPHGFEQYVGELVRGVRTREEVLRAISESAEAARLLLRGPGVRDHVRDFKSFRPRGEGAPRSVLFLHFMKCGGTALTDGIFQLAGHWPKLINIYIDQLVCLPRPMLQQAVLVTGHLPYAAVALVAPDAAVCTVLREPVARTLSHFSHVRSRGNDDLTVEQFVFGDEWRPAWQDHQARQLVVDIPVEEAWRGEHVGPDLQQLIDSWPMPTDRTTLLDPARRRLASIDFVGVSDDLSSVLEQVAELWGHRDVPPLGRVNVAADPVTRPAVADRLIAEIERGTQVDAELYELARDRARR